MARMPTEGPGGTAIQDHVSAHLTRPRPAHLRRGADVDAPETRRFSPLNAPQRAALDAFIEEARPWAVRRARRAYRHLPDELHSQAVDRALQEFRFSAPKGFDRRTLYAELSEELTTALRQVHVGWCLNQQQAQFREEGPPAGPDVGGVPLPVPPARVDHPVAAFVDNGLGGLERAVLQMEIGAGRDGRTTRAALRLGPRHYARHREDGLVKLRAAIAGHVTGRVCDQHLDAVILAATGDRAAADVLASGPDRCRSCAREAGALSRLLNERLAIAPWPLMIKPAGLIAAQAGAVGTLFGGKGSVAAGVAGTASGPLGTTGGAVATALAAAMVATGAVAIIGGEEREKPRAVTADPVTTLARPAPATTSAPATRGKPRSSARRDGSRTPRPSAARNQTAAETTAGTPAATAPSGDGSAPTTSTTAPSLPSVGGTVRDTTKAVGETVDEVTQQVPSVVAPIQETLQGAGETLQGTVQGTQDTVQGTVDGVTDRVGETTDTVTGLLPK